MDIVKVLLQNGADPNRVLAVDEAASPLSRAAIEGHADVVEVLLESGANVRHLDLFQRSSIWYAIDNQNYDIARRLIREAFRQAVNGEAYTVENAIQDRVLSIPPLKRYFYENYAIYNSDNEPNRPLPTLPPILKDEVASYVGGKTHKNKIQRGGLPAEEVEDRIIDEITFHNRPQRVRELLQSAEDNFDINHFFNGYTLLSLAAENGRVDIVKILLENEADPNRVSDMDYGSSSLVKAAKRGHMDVVEVLLKRNADVRHLDIYHRSSIWYAINNQNFDIARRLIRAAFLQAAVNGNEYTEENATQDRVLGQGNPDLEQYFYKINEIYNQDNDPDHPMPPILKDEAASYVGGKTRKKRNRKRRKHKTTIKRKKNNRRKK